MERKTIYICRHASVDRPEDLVDYFLGPGPSLNKKGIEESRKLGMFLNDRMVDKIYTSPMLRCIETAYYVCELIGKKYIVDDDFFEKQLDTSEKCLDDRIWRRLDRLLEEFYHCDSIVILSHGGPISSILKYFGMTKGEILMWQGKFDFGNPIPPGGVWKVHSNDGVRFGSLEFIFTPFPN